MQFEQCMQAVVGWSGLRFLEKTIMLEVLLFIGVSSVGTAWPIITPATTTLLISFMAMLFWVSMLLSGVPIFTSRFFGSAISPFRVVTLDMSGSPSKTAFAMH